MQPAYNMHKGLLVCCIGKDPLYATSQQLYTEHADIAQQVERILGKDEVPGSNPGISSRSLAETQDFFVVLGYNMQDFARSPSFSKTSLLFLPDLSQSVSQIR